MKIEIDADVLDSVICSSIKETVAYLESDIAALRKRKKLKDFEKEDLNNHLYTLAAMQEVYNYYGGNQAKLR